jgi:putative tryptophan/tyrosine transport system substrate-binding protein
MSCMRRRTFLGILGGAAAWPLAAQAQQPGAPVIGFLGGGTAAAWVPLVVAFRRGLSEAGHVEGRGVTIEYRWAEGQYDRLPALAVDLVQRNVNVIAAVTTPAARAAKAATATIPVVFTTIGDPVQVGLVASLSRPGGNVTGVTHLNVEVGAKLLQLMREVVPTASTIALLVNPSNPNAATEMRDSEASARVLGLELKVLHIASKTDIEAAFAELARLRPGGLVLGGDAFIHTSSPEIAAFALRHGIPSIFSSQTYAKDGGLMSYGGGQTEQYRQAGVYTGRILNGEKPSDLPVMQTTKVELIVNLKTAKALGLEIPPMLLARADEVIE